MERTYDIAPLQASLPGTSTRRCQRASDGGSPRARPKVKGVTVGWDPRRFYLPDVCTRYDFDYENTSSTEWLRVELLVSDTYGTSIM